jgi:dCTP deaminase
VILSDRDLRKAQANHTIVAPFRDEHVQPASIDLRLGRGFLFMGASINAAGNMPLEPGDFALGTTLETVTIPAHLVGQINGRSSWARKGLIVHTTAGFIDPGFTGQVTLELKNVGHETLWLPVGERICQLVLTQLTSPAERPYGAPGLGSHYQGQQGVTVSAIGEHA